ncbi:MAG: response regulator transcription factor [Acidimicrobiales bacterium]
MVTLAVVGDGRSVDGLVLEQLEAIELALGRGDVPAALTCVSSALKWLAPDAAHHRNQHHTMVGASLTKRELATLRLLPDASMRQKDMARALGVSRNTVKSHLKSIYQKLGVHSRAEAIQEARGMGLVSVLFLTGTATSSTGDASSYTVLSTKTA